MRLQLLKKVGVDRTVFLICITVVFSFIPEAGVYSCILVYIRYVSNFNRLINVVKLVFFSISFSSLFQVVGFSMSNVVMYIATVGILSVIFQSLIGFWMKLMGPKRTVLLGLFCEALHLLWFSFASFDW